MSAERWAVLKDADRVGWIVVTPWDVFRAGHGLLDCWEIHSQHSTWKEAMREANSQALAHLRKEDS